MKRCNSTKGYFRFQKKKKFFMEEMFQGLVNLGVCHSEFLRKIGERYGSLSLSGGGGGDSSFKISKRAYNRSARVQKNRDTIVFPSVLFSPVKPSFSTLSTKKEVQGFSSSPKNNHTEFMSLSYAPLSPPAPAPGGHTAQI